MFDLINGVCLVPCLYTLIPNDKSTVHDAGGTSYDRYNNHIVISTKIDTHPKTKNSNELRDV
jgi:hypothetical protein